jgi:hypothetical protein
MSTKIKAGAAVGLGLTLVLSFFIQGVFFIRANAPTYDEAMHLAAGYSYLATGDFRMERQNPPLLKTWLALPVFLLYRLPFVPELDDWRDGNDYQIGQQFLYRSALSADRMLGLARSANLFLGVLVVGLIAWWAYRLWGGGAAIIAAALAAFEPNLIAHSVLVTTDVGASLFFLLAVYFLWEHAKTRRWRFIILTGLSLGAAVASKFSAVILGPLLALLLTVEFLFSATTRPNREAQRHPTWGAPLLRTAGAFLVILLCAMPIILAAYFFHGLGPWISGLERFFTLARVGQPAFFLGEYSYQGWWSYYVVAFLIKTPLGTLILIVLSLVLWRAGSRLSSRDAAYLLLPPLLILAVTTQAKVNIGLRHVLAIYPFLFILAARLATIRLKRRALAPALIGLALIFTAASSLRVAPHQLAYFNEAVGGPDQGYRYLADSNLDWGQDLKNLKSYMDREKLPIIYLSYFGSAPPSYYYGIRYQYVPGTWPLEWPPPADRVPDSAPQKILAISATNLQGVFNPHNQLFAWLRKHQPITKIGYSIFIYDLTEDREGLAKLEDLYAKAGIQPPP